MKLIIALFLCSIPLCIKCQEIQFDRWYNTKTVDKFGDSTGTTKVIFIKGNFSNSATTNSDLIIKLGIVGVTSVLEFYQYSDIPAKMESTETLFYKTSKGEEKIKLKCKGHQCSNNSDLSKLLMAKEFKFYGENKSMRYLFELPKL